MIRVTFRLPSDSFGPDAARVGCEVFEAKAKSYLAWAGIPCTIDAGVVDSLPRTEWYQGSFSLSSTPPVGLTATNDLASIARGPVVDAMRSHASKSARACDLLTPARICRRWQ